MATEQLNCWHCGASLRAIPLPIGRREECPACASALHVCRLCTFYERGASKDCREPMADGVTDKEAANFCDYFRPRPGLSASADPAAAASRARLAALFDEHAPAAPTGGPGLRSASADPSEVPHTDEAEEARRKLRELFGDPDA